MIDPIALFISCLILLVLFTFTIRIVLAKPAFNYLVLFIGLFIIAGIGFIFSDLAYNLNLFWHLRLFQVQNALLSLFSFSFLSILIFSGLKDPSKKKMKTLTRLPIIGLLLGWYLSGFHVAIILGVLEITALFIAAKNKKTHNFIWRAQLKAFLSAPLIAMYSLPLNSWFLVYFCWTLIFKLAVANAAIVKKTMLDYDESLKEK
jgi:hypothetical protein